MTSLKQQAANRANAQRSTGPRTEEGKAASSKNAFKHGITARCVLDGEVKEDLDILLKDYNDRLRPVDGLEEQLVFNMVMLEWQIRRIRIIKHEAVPQCGSFEVRFPDGRQSVYFYWDDLPSRRLRPETLDRETALEQAKALARAAGRHQ